MFHPITPQVIRQALLWANLIVVAVHAETVQEHADGGISATYTLQFRTQDVGHTKVADMPYSYGPLDAWLQNTAQSCFCDDIKVGSCWYSFGGASMFCNIYITLKPEQAILEGELAWLID